MEAETRRWSRCRETSRCELGSCSETEEEELARGGASLRATSTPAPPPAGELLLRETWSSFNGRRPGLLLHRRPGAPPAGELGLHLQATWSSLSWSSFSCRRPGAPPSGDLDLERRGGSWRGERSGEGERGSAAIFLLERRGDQIGRAHV